MNLSVLNKVINLCIPRRPYGKGVLKKHMGYTGLAVVNDGEQPAYDIAIHNIQINEGGKLTFHCGHTERLTKDDGEAFYRMLLGSLALALAFASRDRSGAS